MEVEVLSSVGGLNYRMLVLVLMLPFQQLLIYPPEQQLEHQVPMLLEPPLSTVKELRAAFQQPLAVQLDALVPLQRWDRILVMQLMFLFHKLELLHL
jgi:hypothetical protein